MPQLVIAAVYCAVLVAAIWALADATLHPERWVRRADRLRDLVVGLARTLLEPRPAPAREAPQATEPAPWLPEGTTAPPALAPALERREMTADESGAENWGSLLRELNTAEQVIIHEETWRLRQDMLNWERPALDAFSQAVDKAIAGWCECPEHLHLKVQHAEEVPTGAWPLVYVGPLDDDERELVLAT